MTAGKSTLQITEFKMSDYFKGKKLLVVGGTSGMGLETARMVLKAGGSVVLTGNKKTRQKRFRKS